MRRCRRLQPGQSLSSGGDGGDRFRAVIKNVAGGVRGGRSPWLSGCRGSASRAAIASSFPNSASPHQLAIPDREWGIQVGAFASPALARAVAEGARTEAPGQLHAAAITLPPVASGGAVLYRARLVNLSASAAANACTNLNRRQLPCVVVQPQPVLRRLGSGGPGHSAGAGTTTGRRQRMRAPPAQSRLAISSAATTTSTNRGRPESMIMP